jgi:hypothetical protein
MFRVTLSDTNALNEAITTLTHLRCSKPDYINNYIHDFYNCLSDAKTRYKTLSNSEKCEFTTFIAYFRSYLFKLKNTKLKINTETNIAILTKKDYDTYGFTLMFSTLTYELLDVQYIEKRKEESFDNISSIESLIDGTNIIAVVQNGELKYIRTNGTFDAGTKYDTTFTHKEIFYDLIDTQITFDFSKIFEFTKLEPDVRYCFNFIMELNYTPVPKKDTKNKLNLIRFYKINNKKEELQTIIQSIQNDTIDEEEELIGQQINSFTSNYIEVFNNNDTISLFNNINAGILNTIDEYKYEGINIKQDLIGFISEQPYTFKGISIKYNDGSYFDIIGTKYTEIIELRPNCSLEFSPENERKLFNELFLNLLFKENRDICLKMFYEYYDVNKQFLQLFRTFDEKISGEFVNNLMELYKKNRIQEIDSMKRNDLDALIPDCFKCGRISTSFLTKYKIKYSNQGYDFIKMIHAIYIYNKQSNKKYSMEVNVIRDFVYYELLKDYFDSYKKQERSVYGDMYGKIMTPKM